MADRTEFSNKTIVITGASSGFGRGAAEALARRGAHVVMAARRGAALNDMVQALANEGCSASAVETDVSDPAQVAQLAQAAEQRYGQIDIWINNVGIGALGYFWEIPLADQARIIDVNLKGVVYGAHEALRRFCAQRSGTLINMGSVDSEVPLAFQTTYAATKAAVLSISRSLAAELKLAGQDDVAIATIMPWAVDTPWWHHAANYTGHKPRMAAMDDPQVVIDVIVEACRRPKLEMPAGFKAQVADWSHHLFPGLTEKMSGKTAQREIEKADFAPNGPGAIYKPRTDTARIDGGVRERKHEEDSAA